MQQQRNFSSVYPTKRIKPWCQLPPDEGYEIDPVDEGVYRLSATADCKARADKKREVENDQKKNEEFRCVANRKNSRRYLRCISCSLYNKLIY